MAYKFIRRCGNEQIEKLIDSVESIAFNDECSDSARVRAMEILCKVYDFTEEELDGMRNTGLVSKISIKEAELEEANNTIKTLSKEIADLKRSLERDYIDKQVVKEDYIKVRRGKISKEELLNPPEPPKGLWQLFFSWLKDNGKEK